MARWGSSLRTIVVHRPQSVVVCKAGTSCAYLTVHGSGDLGAAHRGERPGGERARIGENRTRGGGRTGEPLSYASLDRGVVPLDPLRRYPHIPVPRVGTEQGVQGVHPMCNARKGYNLV